MKNKFLTLMAAAFTGVALFVSGCATESLPAAGANDKEGSSLIILREGDVVKISFPGSANLDTTQQIRRDGKIAMNLIGEIEAAGLTPDGLQKKLIELYATQIGSKEITVAMQTSAFPVFVNGAVVHPGKIMSDHPITALEAVMEAGGFVNATANMKDVKVIRNEGGKLKNYRLNLKEILDGTSDKSFYLKPADIVFVPERFQMF